jgi:hypothetical protein
MPGTAEKTADATAIRPFEVEIPDEDLDDLRRSAGARSCCGSMSTGARVYSRMAACATSTSLRATTSRPTARVRRRAGEATM